jgi:acyl carrier protein
MDFATFIRRVEGEMEVDLGSPLPTARLEEDLALDSIARYELMLVVEELVGRELPDQLLDGIETLGEAYDWVVAAEGS